MVMAFSTSSGAVMPRVKRIENGIPTPTFDPSSGVKIPTKVFFGVNVVKDESSAASRPSESFATACTLYSVAELRWIDGVQVAPSPDISPAIFSPLSFSTVTSDSLPLAALTLRAPLVATSSAPFFGAMETTASEALVAALSEAVLSEPFPLSSPEPVSEPPPPPHAVTASSIRTGSTARAPLRRRVRAPTDAPDIGRPFNSLFSPRTA